MSGIAHSLQSPGPTKHASYLDRFEQKASEPAFYIRAGAEGVVCSDSQPYHQAIDFGFSTCYHAHL